MGKPQAKESQVDIVRISTGVFEACVLGKTPLILNRMSQKAWHELLAPRGRLSTTEKATNLKHNPVEEYRASPYKDSNPQAKTLLLMMSSAFKGALRSVATDMPGAAKAQIGRLTYVEGEFVSLYGVPRLSMAIVRSADMNRTPDVRTRAILPQWACRVSVTYVMPILTEAAVANLLGAAGLMRGVGDWRPEKGAGNFGQFELVAENDPRYLAVLKTGGRKAQEAAMEHPEPYDAEAAEMMTWFEDEMEKRQKAGKSATPTKVRGNGAAHASA